jgi:hypothetical protein
MRIGDRLALERHLPSRAAFADALFLTSITVLSLASYVGKLGFYLDDYPSLRLLAQSHSHSFFRLYDALYAGTPNAQLRPVRVALLAGLYTIFGGDPHPYHLFNAAVLLVGVLLIYVLLRELSQSRLVCVAAALLYTTLPHFSSDRFWVAAFQANVSMALYFASQYAALRALRATRRRWLVWLVIALLAAVGSALAYEVALGLFLLTPFLIVYQTRQRASLESEATRMRRRVHVILASSIVSFVATVAVKVVAAVRLGHESSYHLGFGGSFLRHLAYLVAGSIKVSVGSYGLGLPYVVGWVVVHELRWTVAVLTLITGVTVFAYLRRFADIPSTGESKRLIGGGIVVFVLGYAVFVTNPEIFFTSAGIDNRVNIAAATGIALIFVGAIAWFSRALPVRWRGRAFAIGMSVLCMAGFMIVNALGSFWVEAAQKQEAVLAAVQARLPTRPGRTTLLLDGVCPEIGPAIVFTTQYDLTGALFLKLHDPNLNAAVVSPYVRMRERFLSISYFFNGRRTSLRSYPYGPKTFVFNYERKLLYRLDDVSAARHYFGALRARLGCPPIRSFIWGIPASLRRFMA